MMIVAMNDWNKKGQALDKCNNANAASSASADCVFFTDTDAEGTIASDASSDEI